MNRKLVEFFQEHICAECNDKKECRKKPHKMLKCGNLFLVKREIERK
jgi:hypothetical protein